jgi:hypothetical protein
MTNSFLTPLTEAVTRLERAWAGSDHASDLTRGQLLQASEAIGVLQRCLDAVHADVAAAIAHESRAELGATSLAKQQGFRTPAAMIASTVGGSTGDAARLVKVGEATAPRTNLVGEPVAARYPALQSALREGRLGAAAAALIVAVLERLRVQAKIRVDDIAEIERQMVARSRGLSLDEVRRLVTLARDRLDPIGVGRREDEARAQRALTMFERDGMLHLNLQTDIASGAPIRAAVQAYVTATFQARATAPAPEAADADHRTVAMIQADALTAICGHAIGCDNGGMPLTGATVVVRVNLEDLEAATGSAVIDGSDQAVSISTCRRLAAGGGVIPAVLGAHSEILDWGREKRFFTRAQRLALVERDGGCAMCGLPPQMTKAHHIRWWSRDAGPTDLDNGVLLCESCHHRIHDNDWEIRIDRAGARARVWFVPPPNVDAARTPRPGGKARCEIAA